MLRGDMVDLAIYAPAYAGLLRATETRRLEGLSSAIEMLRGLARSTGDGILLYGGGRAEVSQFMALAGYPRIDPGTLPYPQEVPGDYLSWTEGR